MKKRIMGLVLALCMLVVCLPIVVSAAEKYGDYLYYEVNSDNTAVRITGCDTSATKIEIPAEINGLPVILIQAYAFNGCSNLTSVTIPDSVIIIGDAAFHDCSSLTNITLPNSVIRIGNHAFWGCSNLTSITIPDSVTIIGNHAFWDCSSLKRITIPDSVTIIDNYTFENCSSLTNVTIGNSVAIIGNYAFTDCSSLTSVTIGNNITTIGEGAFNGCSNLTSITIPDSVTIISNYAFKYCSNLKSVTIGNGVTNIYFAAFSNCDSLTDVYYSGSEAQWKNIEIDTWNESLTTAVHYNSSGDTNQQVTSPSPISPSDWAKSDIEKAIELGLIPEELQTDWQTPITRLDFCKLAYRIYTKLADGGEILIRANGKFSDVNGLAENDDYAVGTAAELGIVAGYEDGTFKPYQKITRQEAAAMLMRTAKVLKNSEPLEKIGTQFTDCADCADWAMEGIKYVYNADIMKGTSESYQSTGVTDGYYNVQFSPYDTYTREQAMVTFYRLYNKIMGMQNNDTEPSQNKTLPLVSIDDLPKDVAKAIKKYENSILEYKNALKQALIDEQQKKELKKQMIAAMKEHWQVNNSTGKNNIPDEVYLALYMFTGELGEFEVISKDHDWAKSMDLISGCIDMTMTTLSNIGNLKQSYTVDNKSVTIDSMINVGKTGFGTIYWDDQEATFVANPKETMKTFQALVTKSLNLVGDIYTDQIKNVFSEIAFDGDAQQFLKSKVKGPLNNFMKEMGLGDVNETLGELSSFLNFAYSISSSDNAEDMLNQMKSISQTDIFSNSSLTDIMVKEALKDIQKLGESLIKTAEKRIYK